MRWLGFVVLGLLVLSPAARAAEGFELKDTPGQYLDVLLDGKIAARYMYAHDTSTKEKRLETYKPYLHVFDAEGKEPITQGAGGKQFPHHRGIYIGWKKIAFEGKQYNLWEMASGDIVHEKFLNQHADADSATFTSLTHWNLNKPSTTLVDEERTMTFHRAPAPGRLVIDFTSKLTAPAGDLVLDADPEHGGVQYRPAGDIVAKETVYEFPTQHADPHKDKDYPWVAETYTLRGHRYSVVQINSPQNPTNTRWSAYRDYGRFGAFPKASLKKGDSLTLKYRFLIADGELPPADYIQKQANDFTGLSTPTPPRPPQALSDPPTAPNPPPKSPSNPVPRSAPPVHSKNGTFYHPMHPEVAWATSPCIHRWHGRPAHESCNHDFERYPVRQNHRKAIHLVEWPVPSNPNVKCPHTLSTTIPRHHRAATDASLGNP